MNLISTKSPHPVPNCHPQMLAFHPSPDQKNYAYPPLQPQNPKTLQPQNHQTSKPSNPQNPQPQNLKAFQPSNPQTPKPSNPQTLKPQNPKTRKPQNHQTQNLKVFQPSNPQTLKPSNPQTLKPSNPQTPKPQNPKTLLLLLLLLLSQTACVKYPQLLYFRDKPEFVPLQGHEINNQLRIKIQTDDVLFIMVRALDQETAEPFNLFGGTGMQMMSQMANTNPSLQGYLVDVEGNIDLPVLGRVNVAGKTVEEAKNMLLEKLKPYLNEPVIIMRFLNFRFTVLGEVKAPRTITVPGERITILEALGQAGDLTPYSNREKIMVIRENNNKREFGYVNIHSPDIFQSPYFYLQQNDIIYVEPIKEATAVVRDPIQESIPIISGIISVAALIIAFVR